MRVTKEMLEDLCETINEVTGNPTEPYTMIDGKYTPNAGNYHLDWAYGGVGLQQMCETGSGTRKILGGFFPKRELGELMQAYLQGIREVQ